jgi:transposase-like protein/biotin operon repressor
MGEFEVWLSRAEVQELLGISQQAISKAIQKGKFKVQEIHGVGGRQYRIALSSLPAEAQVRYLQAHPNVWQEALKIKELSEEAKAFLIKKTLPQKEENEISVRVATMDRAWAIKEYLQNPCYETAKRVAEELKVHVSTIYRWIKKAEEEAERIRMMKLEKQTVPIKFPRTSVPEDVLIESLSIILSSHGKRIINGWQYVVNKGYDISYSQYTRILNKMTPPFSKLLEYHRSGRISALLTETPKIIRAWSELPVMHTLVGDQHYLDYYMYSPELDEVVKVQLYIWADCSSRYFVSCVPSIGGQYTQWHVQASLAEAFRIHVPSEIYTDWGKQENSKMTAEFIDRLSSGKIYLGDWDDFLEKYPEAKIARKRSTPGVPPVKPIENMIRRFTEFLNQEGLTGYAKRDLKDPFRNKQIQELLKAQIKKKDLPTLEEGLKVIANVIEKCNITEIKTKEGKRFIPAEFLWKGLEGRRVVIGDDEIAMIFFPAFVRKVRNASVQVKLGTKTVVFTAKELTWLRDGEEVMIKVNPFPPHEGSMFFRWNGSDWEFLAPAIVWIGHRVHPQDQEKLAKAMEVKNHYLKQFVLAIREIHERAKNTFGVVEDKPIRKLTSAIKHKQEGMGDLVFLDIKKFKNIRDKNWEALGKLADFYDY